MLNGSWLTRDDELVNNSRYRSEIQWPSALQVLRSFVSRFRIFDQQYEISLQYKRNRFEISLLDQRIFAQLTENSTNFRLRDHEISPEISAIFRLNNSRNSAKFVCILFAQYCICTGVSLEAGNRQKSPPTLPGFTSYCRLLCPYFPSNYFEKFQQVTAYFS